MIIGSTAIKHYFPDFPRNPKDLDIIVKESTSSDNNKVEYLLNPVLLDYYGNQEVCPLNGLYTLKISHLAWDINWKKHIWDVQWLKEKGCKIDDTLFYLLYEMWIKVHGKVSKSNLDMTSADFFNNLIKCEIPHDELHLKLMTHDYFTSKQPSYFKVLKDGHEVLTDEAKFNQLSESEKLDLTMEEVMVMAFERMSHLHYNNAFDKMLKKFIINHAPVWQSKHIIQNHKQLLLNVPFDFINYLKNV